MKWVDDSFTLDKHNIACKFLNFADEILAEQLLRVRHPNVAADRASDYVEMRLETAASGQIDRVDSRLRCWAILYEIVRNDLGVAITANSEHVRTFTEVADRLVERLKRDCSDVSDDLLSRREGLLRVDVRRADNNFGPFDDAFQTILNIPA